MQRVEKVRDQAAKVKKIFDEFLGGLQTEEDRRTFRASFHLRLTSSGTTTIVSTLPSAPMRGIDTTPKNLKENLNGLCGVLSESDEDKQRDRLKRLGYNARKSIKFLEEDAQAAFIRDVILHPGHHDNRIFVVSEFELFGFEENEGETGKPDVFVYKDGILYDVEFKNKRIASGKGSPIPQANRYVEHMMKPGNFVSYTDCLAELPNGKIGEIEAIRGVAYVPKPQGKSSGKIEASAKAAGVELWEFGVDVSMNNVRLD